MKRWLIILIVLLSCVEKPQEQHKEIQDIDQVEQWAQEQTTHIKVQRQQKVSTIIDSMDQNKIWSDAEIEYVTQMIASQDSIIHELQIRLNKRDITTIFDTLHEKVTVYDTVIHHRHRKIYDTAYITDTIHLEMTVKDCRDCKKKRK